MPEAAFASNGAFLDAALRFVDRCLKAALSRRAGGLSGPRGLAATAELATAALAAPRPLQDPVLAREFESLFACAAQTFLSALKNNRIYKKIIGTITNFRPPDKNIE